MLKTLQMLLRVILFTWLAVPVLLLVQFFQESYGSVGVFVLGVLVICGTAAFLQFFVPKPESKDPWFFAFVLFAFFCVIDLFLALETLGLIKGWVGFYLKFGEEYLNTKYGVAINLWDATAHYFLYISMVSLIYKGKDYRLLGLYWSGSIFNSLLTIFGGAASGPFRLQPSIALNLPFLLLPALYIGTELQRPRNHSEIITLPKLPTNIFRVYFPIMTAYIIIRAIALTSSQFHLAELYRSVLEPSLNNPTAFHRFQILVYLFYLAPFYAIVAFTVNFRNSVPGWIRDLSLIFAGLVANGQVGILGQYFLELEYSEPYPQPTRRIFWVIQTSFTIGIHVFAVRCALGSSHKKKST